MKLDKNFLLYLLYRGLSSFFFVVAVYTLMLDKQFNLMQMSLYSFLALLFMYAYNSVKPKQTLCLETLHPLLSSFIKTFLMIGYGVFVLGLYMTLLSKELPIEVVSYAFIFFVSMSMLYIYLCKRGQ